ncbi:MAG TPA: hypothetical protein VNH13_08955 [Candidatus Acidoferrales bacterium]|nr:hypothetical protein [Candidatus Acidoferrales bacterium]
MSELRPGGGAVTDTTAADDLRLARLHLRLGMLASARAELEDLDRRGALDLDGRAALAEARWRTGDLDHAADAAQAHLDAGGSDPIAIVVAAEAAAANGFVAEARELVERLGAADPARVDGLFAGMPRRAHWPAATGPATPGPVPAAASGSAPAASEPAGAAGGPPPRIVPGPAEVMAANARLWDDDAVPGAAPAGPRSRKPAAPQTWVEPARQKGHADPEAELEIARDELAEAPDRGLLRLGLVLRLDPTLAPDVLAAVRLRREPAAAVLRGDAQRLLGRHLEAEAAYADAAESMERDALAHARPGGPAAPRPPAQHTPDQEES